MILREGKDPILSATDLSDFLSCRHRTALEMAAASGKKKRPYRNDPFLKLLWERGKEHEKKYVDSLHASGLNVVDLSGFKDPGEAVAPTLAAMRSGADAIVQAALQHGGWHGRPDVMLRVERPSRLGRWSYEIADTKLARETRAGTILQLGLYCEMLAAAQGVSPEHFRIITPDPDLTEQKYRVDDYAAYFRLIRAEMAGTARQDDEMLAAANYPEPVEHCHVCPWSGECDEKRHRDDHLSLVAGISRLQRRELESRSVPTLTGLAALPVPLPFKPDRGSVEAYVRVRDQARVQLESRGRIPHPLR